MLLSELWYVDAEQSVCLSVSYTEDTDTETGYTIYQGRDTVSKADDDC